MTRTLLVAGTEESTGKTAIALALAKIAAGRGESVGYMKPKGTRLESHVGKTRDEDPMLARELLDLDAEMHRLEPIVYSPTFVSEAIRGREDPQELRATVRECFDDLADGRDLLIVEGADRIDTGSIVDLSEPAVADLLDAEVVLVGRYDSARDVDGVLGAAERFGDRFRGAVFNAVPDAAVDEVEAAAGFLEGRDVPVLGVLPRERDLAGVTVADLADELGAEIVTRDAPTDAYVERFLVGAMSAEGALSYLRRSRDGALITGGDRADLQTVALEAPGVRALVLSGGIRPSGAVVGAAEEAGVPILVVGADTRSTVERAEDVVRSGRTRDERTVETMGRLLADHADTDALLRD
ncbi:phosphotransacetylase family protein [Saliphagus infecundisoli]|uniref:Phosphotransacetylase family protein n=1 Tax=Saliphagus infecundisoli TaxID=1849069 RepID=A0ABD5QH63_9EURY|nr:phosphotransacetylase family protein [Saliphagus infecundisoli]